MVCTHIIFEIWGLILSARADATALLSQLRGRMLFAEESAKQERNCGPNGGDLIFSGTANGGEFAGA